MSVLRLVPAAGLAEVLAGYAGLPAQLLDDHRDDGAGRCAACAWWEHSRPAHPCPTRSAALKALHLQMSALANRPLAKGTNAPLA